MRVIVPPTLVVAPFSGKCEPLSKHPSLNQQHVPRISLDTKLNPQTISFVGGKNQGWAE